MVGLWHGEVKLPKVNSEPEVDIRPHAGGWDLGARVLLAGIALQSRLPDVGVPPSEVGDAGEHSASGGLRTQGHRLLSKP